MSSEITVNEWVNNYVIRLFTCRGYLADSKKIKTIFVQQWDNWKRLMVKSGLNADRDLAEDVFFEFSTKAFDGGAGRIFEHFSAYVLGRPVVSNQIRQEVANQYAYRATNCLICDSRGVVMIPVTRTVQREEKQSMRAYKCSCEAAAPYAGLLPATQEMLDWAKRAQGVENQRLYEWSMQFGFDESNPAEFKRQWCAMFRKPEPKKTPKEELKRFEATIKPAPVKAPELVAVGFDIDQEWSY